MERSGKPAKLFISQCGAHTHNAFHDFQDGWYLRDVYWEESKKLRACDLHSINLLQDVPTQFHFSNVTVFKTQNQVTLSQLRDS